MCNGECIKFYPDKSNEEVFFTVGDVIKLSMFDDARWKVHFGWYSYGHNREVFGVYLKNMSDDSIRPLQYPDLFDVIVVQHGGADND